MPQTRECARQPARTDERPITAPSTLRLAAQSDDGPQNRRSPCVPVDAGTLVRAWQAVVLALSDAVDLALARRCDACTAYQQTRLEIYNAGYAAGYSDSDDAWFASLAPARQAARRTASNPTLTELEARRWGPGGREHFADPRPGDYPGQCGGAR